MLRKPLVAAAAAIAVLIGLVAVTSTAAQASGGKADLVPTSVSVPARATVGAAVTVRVSVRNAGTAKAPGTVTELRLSKDQRVGGDVVLRPTRPTPRLKPRKTWSGAATVTVPASVAPGTYYVIACADATRKVREKKEGNNCRASAAVSVRAPVSSHQLIDADVASGTLTAEQGLIYKVYADFGDPRLPARYAGPAGALEEGALTEAAETWPDLSPAAQSTLRPFLIPPFYAGSHWTPGGTGRPATPSLAGLETPWCSGGDVVNPVFESWDYVETTGGEYRIWWLKKNPGDATQAAHMVSVLEATIIPALTSLMGRGPKSDGGGLCDGGSPATDIALVEARSAFVLGDGSCGPNGTSSHMIFPRTKPAAWAGPDPYLAHEVMHTIQFAMPQNGSCAEYEWLREMTAQWTQDYVTDPAYGIGLAPDDTEFEAAPHFLDSPNTSLDEPAPIEHAYGAYLLAQWAARKGGPGFVPSIWANAATMKPTAAINAALPGDGFVDTWADFALSAYNQGPVDDFKAWDQMTRGAKLIGPEAIPVDVPRQPTVSVNHLASQYLELDIDPKVSELEITNDLAGDADAKLRAVVTYDDGTHKIVDLSAKSTTWICIDTGTKRATKVVLIFSNSHQVISKKFAPTLVGRKNCGCQNSSPRPGGRAAAAGGVCEASSTITFSWTHENIKLNDDKSEKWHINESGSGSLTLDLVAENPGTYVSASSSTYDVSWSKHAEFYDPSCPETADTTQRGSGTLPESATFTAFDPDSEDLWISNAILMTTTKKTHTVTCASDTTDQSTGYLVTPECPPTPQGGNVFWDFEPVAPGSHTYTYSCTGKTEFDDGLGHHIWTHTVQGTVTLPN